MYSNEFFSLYLNSILPINTISDCVLSFHSISFLELVNTLIQHRNWPPPFSFSFFFFFLKESSFDSSISYRRGITWNIQSTEWSKWNGIEPNLSFSFFLTQIGKTIRTLNGLKYILVLFVTQIGKTINIIRNSVLLNTTCFYSFFAFF